MIATGFIRRIDELGRIVIPKEIKRQIFGTQPSEGQPMEFFRDGDAIVLKRYVEEDSNTEQEIRNKAIDEFVEKLSIYGTYDEYGNVVNVLEIAEQLKEGVKNE